jgi:Response regulator containing a CheY-like receiver domain and an HTH DNA-binding domain
VTWCKNTLEIDLKELMSFDETIVIVTEHPGAESNWLLQKTLGMYFSTVIFLTHGLASQEGDRHFVTLRQKLSDLKKQLRGLIFNEQSHPYEPAFADSEKLSRRERHFLALASQGLDCKQVASSMKISLPTVYAYRKKICDKTGMRNMQEVVMLFNDQKRRAIMEFTHAPAPVPVR